MIQTACVSSKAPNDSAVGPLKKETAPVSIELLKLTHFKAGEAEFDFGTFKICEEQDSACYSFAVVESKKNKFTYRESIDKPANKEYGNDLSLAQLLQRSEELHPGNKEILSEEMFLDVPKAEETIKKTNYLALSRCRIHPQWEGSVKIATNERTKLYLLLRENHKKWGGYHLPGYFQADYKTGEIVFKRHEGYDFAPFGSVVLIENALDEKNELLIDNFLINYGTGQFGEDCRQGYKELYQDSNYIKFYDKDYDKNVTENTFAKCLHCQEKEIKYPNYPSMFFPNRGYTVKNFENEFTDFNLDFSKNFYLSQIRIEKDDYWKRFYQPSLPSEINKN
jgi:hypothetical protein